MTLCRRGLVTALAVAATAAAATVTAPGAAAVPGPQPPAGTTVPGACPVPDDPYGGAGDLFALTRDSRLIRLDGSRFQPERTVPVTGLPAGTRLIGLDTRPANGQLYAIGTDARVYVVDPGSGAASRVGTSPGSTRPFSDSIYGLDFNPTVDLLRLVSATGENGRVDVTRGTLAGIDRRLSYRPGDANAGVTPRVTAAAYTNSVAGATSTTLYGIDTGTDSLVLQGSRAGQPAESPNLGRLTTVGRLGLAVEAISGFDIVGTTAYAALRPTAGTRSTLVRIDLATGRATKLTGLPDGVVGLTGSAGPPLAAYAVADGTALLAFDRATPGRATAALGIAGLQPGEQIVGIDVRPATGQLFALGSTTQLYVLNPRTAAATPVGGPFGGALDAPVGFDVNPVVDRIRVVTATGRNLRLNPDDGSLVAEDGALSSGVSAAAYTNSRAGTTTTTLYDLGLADTLVVQNPPNAGTLTTVGPLGVDGSGVDGFDVAADGAALAALEVGPAASALYCVDLGTGRARLAGRIGTGVRVTGLAVALRGVLLPQK